MADNSHPAAGQPATVPVVAIGASAGGLEQLKILLSHMPADTGAAFVVIQHLDPSRESKLTELLAHVSDLPVVTIKHGMQTQADRIHILPPGHRLSIDADGRLLLAASKAREAVPTLIDHFFRDLATARGRRAVGIILSGNGSDGALGLKAIRGAGGLAIAQTPDNAEFDGMPRAAAKHATPDCLLDTADIIAPLANHLRLIASNDERGTDSADDDDADTGMIDDHTLAVILNLLRERDNVDFRHHKPSMIKRRLMRRMALNGVSSTQAYLRTLRNEDTERAHLCGDFLISVTDFFREAQSYAKMNQAVIPKLLHRRSVDDTVRVWVPGCATGEEAYSIAMLLAEAIEHSGRAYKFIIFATDIDANALNHARAGMYPESIEADLSSERLHNFFVKVDDHYHIKRNLREHVVFAPQSVTNDPPYSRLDLISCRNLLIYLNSDTQKRLITLFHFALKETGFLFLGSSETVGNQVDLFEPLSKEHRLYRRLAGSRQYRVDFPSPLGMRNEVASWHDNDSPTYSHRPRNAEQIARDILLAEHVPASVLINRKLEILCSYGPTRDFFSLPLGESSLGLLDMVHERYRSHLRAVTHRAFRYKEQSDISTTVQDDKQQTLLISARMLQQPEPARGLVLVTFERLRETDSARVKAVSSSDLQQQLTEELDATRNELHGTIAALEESNEDLKGSNEEVMSMNEELQSTNEELETSKEELQSVNEELTTVNTELEAKVAELENAHNDLSNLFAGTHVATLFLDQGMRIKRFTPAIRELLNLIATDVGRPLRDMTLGFTDPELLTDAVDVLKYLTPRVAEIQSDDGRWYRRSIMPYRTRDNVIDGVVIIFGDITDLRRAMSKAREHEARLDLAVSALAGGMWEMQIDPDAAGELPDAIYLSARLKNLLGFADDQLPNSLQAWTARIVAQDRAHFADAARRRRNGDVQPLHYRIHHRDGSIRWFASYGRVVSDDQGRSTRWLGIDCDITEHKQAQIKTQQVQMQLQLLADALPQLIAFINRKHKIIYANAAFRDWFGTSLQGPKGPKDPKGPIKHSLTDVLGRRASETLTRCIHTALDGKATSCKTDLTSPKGDQHEFQADHIPYGNDGRILGFYLIMTDMTSRGIPKDNAQQSQTQLAYIQRMSMIGEMSSTLAHDLTQPLGAINNYASALMRMLHAGKPADETTPVVSKIATEIERAGNIVMDVRSFVGRRDTADAVLDIHGLLNSAIRLTASHAQNLDVDTRLTEHAPLPAVKGDTVQIQQVLINLINNAIDAMEGVDSDQRTLWISTASDAKHFNITVTDSGPGIPPGKLETIFDAFESTKLGGMGMGLAISRTIVQWHGGQLWAESQTGGGASFHLSLPVAETTTIDDAS